MTKGGHGRQPFHAVMSLRGWRRTQTDPAEQHLIRVGPSYLGQVQNTGYYLECTNADGAILLVEAKGTRIFGEKVMLTANEA